MPTIDKRQLFHDLAWLGNKVAYISGRLSYRCGAFAIRMEYLYTRQTEKERGE